MKKNFYIHVLFFILAGVWLSPLFAQIDSHKFYGYLQKEYKLDDKNLKKYLINEIDVFLRLFPDNEAAPNLINMQDSLYDKDGKDYESFATALKNLVLYPQSNFVVQSKDRVLEFIEDKKDIAEKKEVIFKVIQDSVFVNLAENRYYNYLKLLYDLEQTKLSDFTLAELQNFVFRFPNDNRIDQILTWYADVYARDGEENEANASYLKVFTIFPDSKLIPYVYYQRAVLYADEFKDAKSAVSILSEVIEKYPDSEQAAEALFLAAKLKEEKIKDYDGAIIDYRKFIVTYPDNDKVMNALWQIAQINHKNLKKYDEAISVYMEIEAKYSTFLSALNALEQIAEIYKKELKDYPNAVLALAKISENHPAYEKSPDYLLDAASLCEDELKDYSKAKFYYELFLKKYPDHKKAKNATKQLQKIQPLIDTNISPLEQSAQP
ncbi:tetratricopeptide repeat protein [candidate division KSB1 bacterium]|nr:tetratricopeptide repeat protein [candidate division KSB1 bacterium]